MNKGEILAVVADLTKSTSFDLENVDDPRMNALVTEAESHIFRDVPLSENVMFAEDLAVDSRGAYILPDDFKKVIAVSMHGVQLDPVPAAMRWESRTRSGVGQRRGYSIRGNRLEILPSAWSSPELEYLTYEPSINSGYDADTGSYRNPSQSNRISQRYPQLYYTRIAFLVSERDLDEMSMARFLSKYNAEAELARTEEGGKIEPVP